MPSDAPTVSDLVRRAADRLTASGSSSPRLDAELLLGFALGVDRVGVLAHQDAAAPAGAAAVFEGYVARRERGEPVAYIRGFREFHGLAVATDPRALIPRPETELLVDEALAAITTRLTAAPRSTTSPPLRIADVGTGSGAIAVALIRALRKRRMDAHVTVVAVDISADALDLARENAVGHGVADRMHFREADLLPVGDAPYAVICANLPYVASGSLAGLAPELGFEPHGALDGGPDGLDVIRRLLERLPGLLEPDGVALLEIGADQGGSIVAAVDAALPSWRCTVQADLAGLPRLAHVEPPPPRVPLDGSSKAGTARA
ncbi:MAG: peptide chain release factor N(5)-glutamine methyltransferase [Chloroflexi bacterium]|nr:peptide chain release factor N(5)-glutamine methyltransferase [Chloroflexota bacterium]